MTASSFNRAPVVSSHNYFETASDSWAICQRCGAIVWAGYTYGPSHVTMTGVEIHDQWHESISPPSLIDAAVREVKRQTDWTTLVALAPTPPSDAQMQAIMDAVDAQVLAAMSAPQVIEHIPPEPQTMWRVQPKFTDTTDV
jgi:hypothetical protein